MGMIRITDVEVLEAFAVRLRLTDGTVREVDLAPFLWGPVFAPIVADRALFEQVFVDPISKTIAWPNGADIDADVLLGEARAARTSPAV